MSRCPETSLAKPIPAWNAGTFVDLLPGLLLFCQIFSKTYFSTSREGVYFELRPVDCFNAICRKYKRREGTLIRPSNSTSSFSPDFVHVIYVVGYIQLLMTHVVGYIQLLMS
jgi:hypothetical protein